ncbi:AAA family ATPase [Amycolatopsis sp. NPDC004625]|uniref:AAA family ATPase n=1 Tax=Amycolatopsis sp. NPDC004625 TaxID=3154670 RepID=UPI0033B4FAF1
MSEPTVIELGPRDLLVVAGLPGAGKTTMLRRAVAGVPVLDSDQVRERLRAVVPGFLAYRWYRPVVHGWHRLRIVRWALGVAGPIVVHEPCTRASTRALFALVGVVSGRPVRLLFLDVPAGVALAGQVARGRVVRGRGFARHVRRVGKWRGALAAGRVPVGWCSVRVVDRGLAGRVRIVARAGAGKPGASAGPNARLFNGRQAASRRESVP